MNLFDLTSSTMNSTLDIHMECWNPPLSEAQSKAKAQADDEYKRFMKKFNESLVKRNAEVVEKGSHITIYEIDCTPSFPVQPIIQSDGISTVSTIKPTPTSALLATSQANLITNNNVLLTNGGVTSSSVFSPTTYQLVVSPRMGLIVSSASPGTVNSVPTITNGNSAGSTGTILSSAPRVQVRPGLGTINPINNANAVQQNVKRLMAPVTTAPRMNIAIPVTKSPVVTAAKTAPIVTSVSSISSVSTRNKAKQQTTNPDVVSPKPNAKGNETTAAVVDLTDDDGRPIPDSKEVSLSKYPGKIYPSLVVVARPSLKIKEMTSSSITAERTQLDTKVKGILSNSATKFTEWLIQQGLVRSEQVCNNHPNGEEDAIFRKLKLGMYSDVSKFPYSGGYIWISDCCPQKFVSVFCNSIFECAPHPPTILLKLMYHWACQTNVHNIISWVKVDNLYIKNFFTNLRAVCTAAVCEKFGKLGGQGRKIEVGVISLGTTSQNGHVRQVKVEVLGVMDPVTKYVRLRAVEPIQNAEKNHKQRFQRILEALDQWVAKNTIIVTDYTVDRAALIDLGFQQIIQSSLNGYAKDNNRGVMDYLKRVVPRMFQNTLSLLSKSIIQQFLDELVWRERWGPIPSRAFDNLILHLAEMTKLDSGDTLVNRLKSITMNPFRDWSFKNWRSNCIIASQQGKRSASTADGTNSKMVILKAKSNAVTPTNVKVGNKNTVVPLIDSPVPIPDLPTIDNLPPSITEVENEIPATFSGSSTRRSRTRASVGGPSYASSGSSSDDNKAKTYAVGNLQGTDGSNSVLMSLENYYYGTVPSTANNSSKANLKELNMKCYHCGLTYNNNIKFMKHLAGHAQDEGAFTTDYRCKYCFKNFNTVFDLEDHEGSVHLPNKYVAMCYICLERFPKRADLIKHMSWAHIELELPYQCSICKFRSSIHTAVVDHFYEAHNGCEKVQCPFCLKIVSFESGSGAKIPQNVNFFFNHLLRHQSKSVRKCSKCVLTFMNKNLVKDHQKDHNSCLTTPGVVRYPVTDLTSTLMPLPSNVVLMTRKGKPLPAPLATYSSYPLSETVCYPDVPISKCVECKADVIAPSQHFTTLYSCMNCRFSSCCKTMITRHVRKEHDQKVKRKQVSYKRMPLAKPLYCVCGFSSSCGNAMASHLAACRRRVAYSSAERAAQYSVQMQSATFPPLVNLDDIEQSSDPSERWMQAFVRNAASGDGKRPARSEPSPPRMLKELGLVRRGPEDDSSKNSELDINPTLSSETESGRKHETAELSSREEDNTNIFNKALAEKSQEESLVSTMDVDTSKTVVDETLNDSSSELEKVVENGISDDSEPMMDDVSRFLEPDVELSVDDSEKLDSAIEKMDTEESTVSSANCEENKNDSSKILDVDNPDKMVID